MTYWLFWKIILFSLFVSDNNGIINVKTISRKDYFGARAKNHFTSYLLAISLQLT